MIGRALATAAVVLSVTASATAGVWPTEVDRLARQLESADAGERRGAATRLATLPAHLVAPLAERALADVDVDVRLAAAAAVVTHRLRGVEDTVVPWLSEPDARLRLAACQVVRARPSARAAAALARVLGDTDVRVRQAAAAALGNAAVNEATVALLGHLDDPVADVRAAIVDALLRLGDARAVVPLLGKVQDGAPEVRRAVARALGELGDRRATASLVLLLRDVAPEVRVEAIASLGALGDASAVLALTPLADGKTVPEVRRAALAAMARIGGPRATAVVVEALDRDELGGGRAPARDALVRMGAPAVPSLLAVIASPPSERAAAAAAEALGAIGAPAARDPIVRALRQGALPAASALRALATLGDPAALGVVLERIADPAPAVRAEARRATDALLAQPNGLAVDPLAAVLADPHTPIGERAALTRLLGKSGSPRAAGIVAPLSRASAVALRLAAVDALGMLGPAGEDAALLAAIDDASPEVRSRAGAALGAAVGPRGAAALVDRADSADAQDRGALAQALAGALARADSATLAKVGSALARADGRMRDAMLEGLGRCPLPEARALLEGLATSPEPGDRRKVAEALAGHPSARATLRTLLGDADGGVRASAAWSLGQVGEAADRGALSSVLVDPTAAVGSNAAVSLGRLSARVGGVDETRGALCGALSDVRSHVRAGALIGLRLGGTRCDAEGEPERGLLADDAAPVVRAAAADLLRAAPRAGDPRDARALARCLREDPYGRVVARCERPPTVVSRREAVSVLVVREGQDKPAPEAPFALVLADGTIRHGVTDRRGGVFEAFAPKGAVALDVPAALSR